MTITLVQDDLPEDFEPGDAVAIDTETMGLNPHRDALCLVQLSSGDGNATLVQFASRNYAAPRLKKLMTDEKVLKIFHFGRFDIAVMRHHLGVLTGPVYCTKIASKMVRTYTDRHGLKDLCRELLNVDLSKQQQSSDWGAKSLTEAQQDYAASDVLYLHRLKAELDRRLEREGRTDWARAAFEFLPVRAELDLGGWPDEDIFAHS